MKAVLMSIQPKWCELIASGKKTVEVRKTKPKLEVPFKVYIYETKDKHYENIGVCYRKEDGKRYVFENHCGKVIGEFVCDEIFQIRVFENGSIQNYVCYGMEHSCVPYDIIASYIGYGCCGYGWHITDLVIYDKPRELGEFKRVCDGNCQSCKYAIWQTNGWAYEPYIVDCKPITRPPQSWCYCEEVKRDGT